MGAAAELASPLPRAAGRRPFAALHALAARPVRLAGACAACGGAGVVLGALLPWMSLYAGLQPLPGTMGSNGKLLAAAGGATLALGVWLALRGGRRGVLAAGLLGLAQAVFAGWLLARLFAAQSQLQSGHPMLVPEIGPGLPVVLAGAALTVAACGWAAWALARDPGR